MASPATQGRLCTKLEEMEVGDYIRCTYTAEAENVAGVFSDLGGMGEETVELPMTPEPIADGYFYFLKVDKGLLIADRLVQSVISWRALNAKNLIFGEMTSCGNFRTLSRDEWKEYITNSDLQGTISKQSVNVWHGTVGSFSCRVLKGTVYSNLETLQNMDRSNVRTALWMDSSTGSYSEYSESHYIPAFYGSDAFNVPVFCNVDMTGWSRKTQYTMCNIKNCFRPALEFIDNSHSKTVYY